MTQPGTLQQEWTEEQITAPNLTDLRTLYIESVMIWTRLDRSDLHLQPFRLWAISNAHRARQIELRDCLASNHAIMLERHRPTHS